MNMERNTIEKNSTIVFDRMVTMIDLNGFQNGFEGDVVIYGDVDICDEVYIPGNLYVIGDISCENLTVRGNFVLTGAILDATNIHVYGSCSINGYIHCTILKVEEDLSIRGEEMYGKDILVAGDFYFNCDLINTENVYTCGNCIGTSKTFFRRANVLGQFHYKRTRRSFFSIFYPVQEIKTKNVEIFEIDC